MEAHWRQKSHRVAAQSLAPDQDETSADQAPALGPSAELAALVKSPSSRKGQSSAFRSGASGAEQTMGAFASRAGRQPLPCRFGGQNPAFEATWRNRSPARPRTVQPLSSHASSNPPVLRATPQAAWLLRQSSPKEAARWGSQAAQERHGNSNRFLEPS